MTTVGAGTADPNANSTGVPRRPHAVTPLEQARRTAGLTQGELSRLAGLSRQKISLAERGEPLGEESWRKLAEALRVDVKQIKPPVG